MKVVAIVVLGLAVTGVLAMVGCEHHHHHVEVVVERPASPPPTVVVAQAPVEQPPEVAVVQQPPPPVVVETYGPPPQVGVVWIGGYYTFCGGHYVWVHGYWAHGPHPARDGSPAAGRTTAADTISTPDIGAETDDRETGWP